MSGFTRHRRSKHLIATFSGFEADLLRSLAAQLVELLRNEAAVPRDDVDPLEALMDFSGPTTEPEDPRRPDNLWNPIPGDHGAHGAFDRRAHESSWELKASFRRRWIGAGLAVLTASLLLASRRW